MGVHAQGRASAMTFGRVVFKVKDDDGSPTTAAFTITDGINSIAPGQRAVGLYPFPARRIATKDSYPDLYFQAQIYRGHGEHLMLQPNASRRSTEWMREVARRLWTVKSDGIRDSRRPPSL